MTGRMKNHVRACLHLDARARSIYWRGQIRRALGPRTARAEPRSDGHEGRAVRAVLFVCHGNIIRSPMAAALLRAALDAAGASVPVARSAGLHAEPGRPADRRAVWAARSLGVDLEGHRARRLDAGMVARADRIIALDGLIEAQLLARHPDAAPRIALLAAPDRRGGLRDLEIPDPFEGDERDVLRCYEALGAAVRAFSRGLRSIRTNSASMESRHAG